MANELDDLRARVKDLEAACRVKDEQISKINKELGITAHEWGVQRDQYGVQLLRIADLKRELSDAKHLLNVPDFDEAAAELTVKLREMTTDRDLQLGKFHDCEDEHKITKANLHFALGDVERLTRELTEAKWEIKSACQALQDEQNENQKFAELLDQGPHEVQCASQWTDAGRQRPCDCWKKQADEAISGEKP